MDKLLSCLYRCDVMHLRLEPKRHQFHYRIFMFYLNLDEVQRWHERLRWFSYNARNLFSFQDKDHLQRGQATVRENISDFIRSKGLTAPVHRIMLLTHLRTFGYVFNPISIYYCFDAEDRPLCSIAEVGNTFREMKPYLLNADTLKDNTFVSRTAKNFYVSPFTALDTDFDFRLGIPDERLEVYIDDYQDGRKFFLSSLTGIRQALTDARLFWYTVRFPMISLQIMALIHWQALALWMKKLRYVKKDDHPELQQEVYHAKQHRS